jgi:hypothetical protein
VAGYCGHAPWITKIHVLTVFRSFLNQCAAIALKVANQLPPFHSYLEFFDHDLAFGKFGKVNRLLDHANGIDEVFTSLL